MKKNILMGLISFFILTVLNLPAWGVAPPLLREEVSLRKAHLGKDDERLIMVLKWAESFEPRPEKQADLDFYIVEMTDLMAFFVSLTPEARTYYMDMIDVFHRASVRFRGDFKKWVTEIKAAHPKFKEEDDKKRLKFFKQIREVLRQEVLNETHPPRLTDEGNRLQVDSQLLIDKPKEKLGKQALRDSHAIFMQIFPWTITKSHYDEDEEKLHVTIVLTTKDEETKKPKQEDLIFAVTINTARSEIRYEIDMPWHSIISKALDRWRITFRVREHIKFPTIAVVKIKGDLRLNSNVAVVAKLIGMKPRKKLHIDEAKEMIERVMPTMLSNFKTYLTELKDEKNKSRD